MTIAVLDASAVLAFIRQEEGADAVLPYLTRSAMSVANAFEVMNRLITQGGDSRSVIRGIASLELSLVPTAFDDSTLIASLHSPAKKLGLSLADRCCIALGIKQNLPIITADRCWKDLDVGVPIEIIR